MPLIAQLEEQQTVIGNMGCVVASVGHRFEPAHFSESDQDVAALRSTRAPLIPWRTSQYHTFCIMAQFTGFSPKHPQPITLDALMELEPAILSAEISRLENSINHLVQSNTDLLSAETTENDAEDRQVFEDARRENEVVIERQKERITMIQIALCQMIGIDQDNPHYSNRSGPSVKPNETKVSRSEVMVNNEPEARRGELRETATEEDGVFL
ncbi:hypothetical protein CROQUDRAFT_108843 [Cronartium quercuum f. sp. fusiforme G11]|uniref:Uncharacterized protein n=1 Tax=Cronartium quercuum f. sp. fusiforme G11 TaxID=708437 RepID=A0A9P6T9C1_9BASI|nr:hypothetical protein CROQUDRAFT_108843 [Cronartium quercuum f. sp. fusiforme G11]